VTFGLAIAAVQLFSARLYLHSSELVSHQAEVDLALTGFGAVLLVGAARLAFKPSTSSSDSECTGDASQSHQDSESQAVTLAKLSMSSPKTNYTAIIRCRPAFNGLSVQGATLFATAWVLMSPLSLCGTIDRRLLLSTMAVCLPLGEGIGRIGCFFAGCCGSVRLGSGSGREKYPSLQLLSTAMNLASFAWCMYRFPASLTQAGCTSAAANALIRCLVDPLRQDVSSNPFSRARIFALGQLSVSVAIMLRHLANEHDFTTAVGLVVSTVLSLGLVLLAMKLAWQHLGNYASQCKRIVNSISVFVLVYAFSFVIICMVVVGGVATEREPARKRNEMSWALLEYPYVMGCAALSAVLPLLLPCDSSWL
jgi:prolipoprotein diacylglyceryltransferase